MSVISQNGPALAGAANDLARDASEFQKLYSQMYEDLDRCLGTPAETTKIWYGPRAQGCKQLANSKRQTFEEMRTAIMELSDRLSDQVSAWAKMQNSKY